MPDVDVRDGGITLGQLLKLAGVVETGGDVKELLARGAVTVNGEAETRRGRKLDGGDVVRVDGGEPIRVRAAGAA